MGMNSVEHCSIISLPKHSSESGDISVVENLETCPFEIKRVYYLYDIPSRSERGGHAHYELEQYIIAASGSFDVVVDDGSEKLTFTLKQPDEALHLVPGLWREIVGFSHGAICLVLASHEYDEKDYIRDYDEFLIFRNET